ncbi:MAG TPA: hypothetical protein VEV43_06000, partial [Actinomycetota bacterium]|nr:hypothetical protein [Actinomycetota bacterium]
EPTPTPIATVEPTEPPPPPPPPTPEPTETPTPEPTPTPTPDPTPTPEVVPSFRPPVWPPELPPAPVEIGSTPPPEQTLPPEPPLPTPDFTTPPPGPGPLAPLATPNPRPDFGGEDAGEGTGERKDDPTGPGNGTGEDEPPRRLIDLTGDGSATSGGVGTPGGTRNGFTASIADLARTAGEAVKTFAFPLSLTILVVIFLLIQGEIDRRDPKLAFAPVDSSKDMVYFE